MTPDGPDREIGDEFGVEQVWLDDVVVELVACWRCGKPKEADAVCPMCGAGDRPRPKGESRKPARREAHRDSKVASRLLIIYAALLASSVVFGWLIHFGLDPNVVNDVASANKQLMLMLTIEGVFSVLVLIGLVWVPRPLPQPAVSMGRRVAAWLASPLMLGVALAVNFGYHRILLDLMGITSIEDKLVAQCGLSVPLLLAYCVQPAIFEELFFRHLALGSLRNVTGVHGAVFASSIMFGMCHIGVPMSIPILTVVGVVFGYARVWSGGLALPMLLHFTHNLAVILYHGG